MIDTVFLVMLTLSSMGALTLKLHALLLEEAAYDGCYFDPDDATLCSANSLASAAKPKVEA